MVKIMEFPVFKTKIDGTDKKFNLTDPQEQKEYFRFKVGPEIDKLRDYFKENTFIAYSLGKKNSGKGTYSKMFTEIVSPERIDHFSIGDMIRAIDKELQDDSKKKRLYSFLEKNYRGWLSLEKIISALEERSTKVLLPTELILALVKREILRREKKTLFIDGFPRDMDQIAFALFFRDLVGYREDSDIFILIDVPTSVIDERIKWRRICPVCQTSRNLKLLTTSRIGFNKDKKEFYLMCDNPACSGQGSKMLPKEGDEMGIEPIRKRLEKDEKLIKQAFSLYGIPKILLRNSVPVKDAKELVDDYEITPEYYYEWDKKQKNILIKERPWVVLDDNKEPSFSLLPQAVIVSLIKQMVDILDL